MASVADAEAAAPDKLGEIAIFSGEDPAEFRALHQRLTELWRPSGPTADDAVLTLAIAQAQIVYRRVCAPPELERYVGWR
jgi:hypothetical protein